MNQDAGEICLRGSAGRVQTIRSRGKGLNPEGEKQMNAKALVCWILVSIPLGWGLYQSIQKSKPLFAGTTAIAPAKPAEAPKK